MAKTISSLSVVLGATVAPLVNAFKAAEGASKTLKERVSSTIGTIAKISGVTAIAAGALGAVRGVFGGVGDAISLASTLEQNQVAFETMTGSASKAADLMSSIGAFAAETPFEFPELASSAKKLLAFGTSADQIVPTMRALGDISSGIGAPLNEIAELFGKAKVQGTLMAEDINQLVGRGIPVIQQFAKQMGVSEGQVKEMASKGKINFSMLQQAVVDMTGAGGQFSGMMAKQSQTLGGLWSTLTDGISMSMAGMVQTIVDAFNLKGALASLANAVNVIGPMLQGAVGVIAEMAKRLYDAIAPTIAAIGTFISENWQGAVVTVSGYVLSLGNFLGSVFSVIGDGVTAAAGYLGGFQSSIKTLYEYATLAFNVMAFGVKNWKDIIAAAMLAAAYDVVKFANQVEYFLVDYIGGYLAWFGRNWKEIFADAFNYTNTVFSNLLMNAANFGKALWEAVKGNGFQFDWQPLTEGFRSAIVELPRIAERQAGELEKTLGDASAAIDKQLSQGLGQYLADQDAKAKAAADAITRTVKGVSEQIKGDIKPPKLPDAKINVDTKGAMKAIEAVKGKADELKAIAANSAESAQLRAQAIFESQIKADTAAVAVQSSQVAAARPLPSPVPANVNAQSSPAADQATLLATLLDAGNKLLQDIKTNTAKPMGRVASS